MGRISTSIEIMKASLGVVRKDKSLAWLPVLSFAASAVTMAIFAGGIFLTVDLDHEVLPDGVRAEGTMSPLGYVLIVAMYLVLAFVTIFFNAALISGARERLEGGNPTLDSALAGATSRLGLIFRWSLVSATVSMVLNAIQREGGLLGRIAGGLAGIAWSLVTFLVLPVMVIEGLGVKAALGRSKDLFVRTWGEQVVGNVAIGLLSFLAILPGIALAGIGVALAPTSVAITVTCVALAVVWIGVVLTVSAATNGVFQTALYLYAANGAPPAGFDGPDLSLAFRPKR